MGYYIRVLGTSLAEIPLHQLETSAHPAVVEVLGEAKASWEQFVLKHADGPGIAVVEKNLVADGELGAEEIEEFLGEMDLYRPESAVRWLQEYLPRVKVIYAFQLLSGTDVNEGWSYVHKVYDTVWKTTGGILQADGEGFSNEEGYTILWQFSESVTGSWNAGVLINGRWTHFEMDLGNQQHREAFWQGEVPAGAKILNES